MNILEFFMFIFITISNITIWIIYLICFLNEMKKNEK